MRNSRQFSSMHAFRLGLVAALLSVATLAVTPKANANPIAFYNDASTSDTLRFTLTCDTTTSVGDCSTLKALYSFDGSSTADPITANNPAWDDATGDLFALNNAGNAESPFVSALLATSLTGAQTSGSGESFSFTTSADYFLIKIGNKYKDESGNGLAWALLYNGSGDALDLSFEGVTGVGAGFSHYTEFCVSSNPCPTPGGGGGDLPEPSSLGMLGIGLAFIAGLIAVNSRKRKAHAD